MKKLVVMILCVACLLGGIAISEVNFRVEDYTDDELIDIMKAIYDADTQLGYWYSNEVLIVGQDIPVGAYEFWVEESDISLSKDMLEDPMDYHCAYSRLCLIEAGNRQEGFEYYYVYYDEYGMRIKISLGEGDEIQAVLCSGGADFMGFRMKYFPNRRSGLFSN